MTSDKCGGFAVLKPSVFYEIPYPYWKQFFDESVSKGTLQKVEGSYGVHVWNKMSGGEKITVGSETAYGLLAERHCPGVYRNCGPEF
jgi:lactosylceramide 4-alpha-galactosyltransferase